jgi:hypothetical protein
MLCVGSCACACDAHTFPQTILLQERQAAIRVLGQGIRQLCHGAVAAVLDQATPPPGTPAVASSTPPTTVAPLLAMALNLASLDSRVMAATAAQQGNMLSATPPVSTTASPSLAGSPPSYTDDNGPKQWVSDAYKLLKSAVATAAAAEGATQLPSPHPTAAATKPPSAAVTTTAAGTKPPSAAAAVGAAKVADKVVQWLHPGHAHALCRALQKHPPAASSVAGQLRLLHLGKLPACTCLAGVCWVCMSTECACTSWVYCCFVFIHLYCVWRWRVGWVVGWEYVACSTSQSVPHLSYVCGTPTWQACKRACPSPIAPPVRLTIAR